MSATSIAVPSVAGRDVRYAAAPAASAASMKSWPSRSATSGTNSWPGAACGCRNRRRRCRRRVPTNRPPVAAATSLALNRIAAHGTVGATWEQAIESSWWCCSAASRPSTTSVAPRRHTCCAPPIRRSTRSRPSASPATDRGRSPKGRGPRWPLDPVRCPVISTRRGRRSCRPT